MNVYLIVALVKEVMFQTIDENISDYNIDDLLLMCLLKMEEQDGIDLESLVKESINEWNDSLKGT